DQAVDDDLDRVLAVPVELDVLGQLVHDAVHARARKALAPEVEEELPVLALPAADDGAEDEEPRAGREREDAVDHLLHRLGGNDPSTARAVRDADPREQHAEVVVDLGDGPDGGARILRGRLLLDRDRGRQPLDRVDVGLFHLLEELPGVGGQGLDVPPLALGVDRIEGERRLARPREARDHDELVARDLEVNVLQVVLAGALDEDPIAGHARYPCTRSRHAARRTLALPRRRGPGSTPWRPGPTVAR